jgi:hypothetical protein
MPRHRQRRHDDETPDIPINGRSKLKLPRGLPKELNTVIFGQPMTCLDDLHVFYVWLTEILQANKRIPGRPPGQPACHRIDGEHDKSDPDKMNEYRAAIYLKIAMAHGARCPDLRCRRIGICQKPPLQCEKRPLADAYDWDRGWWFSKRKQDLYEVTSDREFLGAYSGPEDKWIEENHEIARTLQIKL